MRNRNITETLKTSVSFSVLILVIILVIFVNYVKPHGRLLNPPGRSSLWRNSKYSDDPTIPTNYDDAQLYCGGVHQKDDPGRNCGVCGDPISAPAPRPNEIGGRMYRGIITGQYESGGLMYVEAQITAPHMGHMEWRLCTNPRWETQDCFDQNVLQIGDGTGSKLPVGHSAGTFWAKLRIPENITCEHCILQWNYRAGNNWGMCSDGEGRLGCGPQETFRACSDVRIMPRSSKTAVKTSTQSPAKLNGLTNEVDVDNDDEDDANFDMSNELKAYLLKLLRRKGKRNLLELLGA